MCIECQLKGKVSFRKQRNKSAFPHISEQLDFTAGVYVNSGSNHSFSEKQMFCISGQLFPVHNFINTDADFGFIVVFPRLHVIMGYVGVY